MEQRIYEFIKKHPIISFIVSFIFNIMAGCVSIVLVAAINTNNSSQGNTPMSGISWLIWIPPIIAVLGTILLIAVILIIRQPSLQERQLLRDQRNKYLPYLIDALDELRETLFSVISKITSESVSVDTLKNAETYADYLFNSGKYGVNTARAARDPRYSSKILDIVRAQALNEYGIGLHSIIRGNSKLLRAHNKMQRLQNKIDDKKLSQSVIKYKEKLNYIYDYMLYSRYHDKIEGFATNQFDERELHSLMDKITQQVNKLEVPTN